MKKNEDIYQWKGHYDRVHDQFDEKNPFNISLLISRFILFFIYFGFFCFCVIFLKYLFGD